MNILFLLLFGLIQGITEFLPISSSAHLLTISVLFGLSLSKLDSIFLHVGTLLSLIVYFKKDIYGMLLSVFSPKKFYEYFFHLTNLILSTLPLVIAGIFVYKYVKIFEIATIIGSANIICGILLYVVDKYSSHAKYILSKKDAFVIGLMQIFSIIPGVSRSGICITASRLLGYNRELSVNWSFMMALPSLAGAIILGIFSADYNSIMFDSGLLLIFSSFIFSIFAVSMLIKFVKLASFSIFAFYRILLGAFILFL